MIKITITRYDKNKDFEIEHETYIEKQKERERFNHYGMDNPIHEPFLNKKQVSLDVEITEEQFSAIRKEILKNF